MQCEVLLSHHRSIDLSISHCKPKKLSTAYNDARRGLQLPYTLRDLNLPLPTSLPLHFEYPSGRIPTSADPNLADFPNQRQPSTALSNLRHQIEPRRQPKRKSH